MSDPLIMHVCSRDSFDEHYIWYNRAGIDDHLLASNHYQANHFDKNDASAERRFYHHVAE